MAQIGNLGKKIVFQVSDNYILTPQNFTQRVSGKWSKHNVMLGKPRYEFNGADLRRVSFKIMLDAMLGIRPREVLSTLELMAEHGTAETLVIGGRQIGKYKWILTELSETWDVVYNGGELARATCSVTLEEYV